MDRYKQLISYEGVERLRKKITPTDIDGLIDYGGVCFVYLECKKYGKEMDYGQRLALENSVKSHERAGHKSCVFLFHHDNYPNEIIVAKNMYVSKMYRKRNGEFQWKDISEDNLTLLEAIEKWEQHCKIKTK